MDKKNILNDTRKTIDEASRIKILAASLIVVLLIIASLVLVGNNRSNKLSTEINTLSTHIASLENKLSSTTNELRGNIAQNHDSLSNELSQERQSVGNLQQTVGAYGQQVGSVSNTVSTLQKLSKTDPQLLEKYSKVFFLNENYAPARLTEVPSQYKYSDSKTLKLNSQVWPYMQRMLDDAGRASSTTFYIQSAYRSFNEQQALKGIYKVTYGAGSANSFSADQGYSEHQLGTTVDFIAKGQGGELDGFDKTVGYQWLLANAYRYGFILSYPKDNKFYVFEPWHWRFVGVKLATDLFNQKKTFYSMDQRDIDEYLVSLFD